MIRDITIGQYYPQASFIHRLDPRVKLVGTLLYIISLFLFQEFSGYLIVTLFLGVCILASKVPVSYMVKGLKAFSVILLVTAIFNVFFHEGTHMLWQWGIIKISAEGIKNAVFVAVRLLYLVMGSSLMTYTTTPNQLTDGLEKLLRPLQKLHVPVHEVAMMMSIALRFIPLLLEECDKIMKAQMARGADFETGGVMKKAKNMIPLLVPLFVSAFRRSNDLALAMEARCYFGGEGRTKMNPLKYMLPDVMAYVILFVYLLLVILSRYFLKF